MVHSASSQRDLAHTLAAHAVSATSWHAIIDAAQDKTAPQRAAAMGLRTQSLYEGEFGRQLDDVAPHLVSLSLQDEFAEWLFDNWGGNHGVLLQSKAPFTQLRRHLRKYLLVKNEEGRKYRFRYYDPRVLRSFLPSCSREEGTAFFGPVARYYTADRSGTAVVAFGWGPRGLIRHVLGFRPKRLPGQAGATQPHAATSAEPAVSLAVDVVDAETQVPIVGASVQVSGPVTDQAVTSTRGRVRFSNVATGKYTVIAMDAEGRYGERMVRVEPGQVHVRVACQRPASVSSAP
ncbi:MAG: DUF4123 domain-containing protein [bacterium]|nr:DUF4123 domain-containing protein [bacterium]